MAGWVAGWLGERVGGWAGGLGGLGGLGGKWKVDGKTYVLCMLSAAKRGRGGWGRGESRGAREWGIDICTLSSAARGRGGTQRRGSMDFGPTAEEL